MSDEEQNELIMKAIIGEPELVIEYCSIYGCNMTISYELDMDILLSEKLTVRSWPIIMAFS